MKNQGRVTNKEADRSSFFVWMAGLCLFFAFAGFTPTYFSPLATGSLREINPAVHIHGLLFFLWTLLFLVQTFLVVRGNTTLHRSLGLVGISLATAMVILGLIVSLRSQERRIEAGELERAYALGLSGFLAMVLFGTLFALAIKNIRRPDFHKRLMLFATCMLLQAAVGRLYRPLFDPAPPEPWVVFMTVDIIPLACLLYDLKTLRKPHVVTLVCGSLILALQLLRPLIAETETWHRFYDSLLQLIS